MPRGIPNKPKTESTPPPIVKPDKAYNAGPAPLIIIQPAPEGTTLDVYGINVIDAIDEMRLALLHLVAMQTDVPIISAVISRQTAVALPDRNPVPVRKPSDNGTGPRPRPNGKRPTSVFGYDQETAPVED